MTLDMTIWEMLLVAFIGFVIGWVLATIKGGDDDV